jgi:hypothetical protein
MGTKWLKWQGSDPAAPGVVRAKPLSGGPISRSRKGFYDDKKEPPNQNPPLKAHPNPAAKPRTDY